jgi:disulfide bond formation protein DsbB
MLLNWTNTAPRRVWLLVCLACLGLLGFGLYLQHVVGLEPCPMCIVQRYALVLVAILAGAVSASGKKSLQMGGVGLLLLVAGFGAFVAARQSFLQWYPPKVATCGRDLYGMIETFPLKRAIPMIFKGGGDCSVVDWTFLGGSIANWSFVCFGLIAVLALVFLVRSCRRR